MSRHPHPGLAGRIDLPSSWLRREARDARSWQILSLACLLTWAVWRLPLGASLAPSLVAVGAALTAHVVIAAVLGARPLDLRSPLITGLSLALLLRGDALWVPAVAAGLALSAKVVLRVGGKHVFNPAAFGIAAMLASGHAWVTPGQWGQSAILITTVVCLATLVLTRAARLDIAVAFLAAHATLLVARAAWLGDPFAIPLHQIQNGALLLFTFFMITDPKTTPDARPARVLFAFGVAGLAHWLLFAQQVRPALYIALLVVSLTVPILDRSFPAGRFVWRRQAEAVS